MFRFLLIATILSTMAALRLPTPATQTRRAALMQAASGSFALMATALPANAKPSELAASGLSNEERLALALKRKAAEEEASKPINKLKARRDRLADATSLIEADNWDALRDLIQQTTGGGLTKLTDENKWTNIEVKRAISSLRKRLYDVDKFAYSQQSFPGSDAFGGYCAPGVVPRDNGGCKMKPAVDKGPLLAGIKEALVAFDDLIKTVE